MIEDVIFSRSAVQEEKLLPYGFVKTENGWVYETDIMAGAFRVTVTVGRNGRLQAKVTDADTGDEYIHARTEAAAGSFASAVRQEYTAVLEQIRAACFKEQEFLFPQANRVAAAIRETYGDVPDHPFERFPSYAAFRCPANRKWYALIMDITKDRLTGSSAEACEIINIRTGPQKTEELLGLPGFYPAYHMNHAGWVSILLDETVADETILDLAGRSREAVMAAGGKTPGERSFWIVPGNPKYYDIEAHFQKKKDITWKQSSRIRPGDIVYMYVAAPVSAVRWKCIVRESDIPYSFRNEDVTMKYVMRLDVLKEYPPAYCPFPKLNEFGIKAVRGPRTAPPVLIDYLG